MLRRNDLVNIFSLMAIQGSNALFPLFVFPLLVIRLSVEKYAALVVSEVIVLYILTVSLYSFEITGVEVISRLRKQQKTKIFTEVFHVFVIRFGILLVTATLVLLFIYGFFESLFSLVLTWLLFPFGMILQSNFYFQAIEKNLTFSFIVFGFRVLSVAMVFLFVNEFSAVTSVALLISGSYFLSGLSSFFYLCIREKNDLNFSIDIKKIKQMLLKDKSIFYGNLSVILFRNSNVLILKFMASDVAVTLYSVCEKIIKTLQAVTRPLNQFYFAKISYKLTTIQKDRTAMHKNKKVIWKACKPQLLLLGCLIALIIFALLLASFFGIAPVYPEKINLMLALMLLAPFFGVANFMFGSVGLNIAGLSDYFTRNIFITGFVTICSSMGLCYLFGDWGAVISYVMGESLLLALIFLVYSKEGCYETSKK